MNHVSSFPGEHLDIKAPPSVTATPFVWREPSTIPPRQWLYGKHYCRKYISATVATAGLGKSTLDMVEAISMVSGRALLDGPAPQKLRVWMWNGEDPLDEMERRVHAILLHFGLSAEDIDDRLFIDSGRVSPIVIATKHRENIVVAEPIVDAIVREITQKQIDVLIIDPFISCHGVPENDNGAIDRVAKTWARIADETGCSIELVHHVRKPSNGSTSEFTVDDARGAVALIGAVRSARVLNVMSIAEAEKADIPLAERRSYFRVDNGKANMQPPLSEATWRKLIGVPLDNGTADDPGDWVAVVTAWKMPSAFEGMTSADLLRVQTKISQGEWRESPQASNWVGRAVADVTGIEIESPSGKARVKALLATWIKNDALRVVARKDEKRMERKYVEVGEWAL